MGEGNDIRGVSAKSCPVMSGTAPGLGRHTVTAARTRVVGVSRRKDRAWAESQRVTGMVGAETS